MLKAELRTLYIEKREELDEDERDSLSSRLMELLYSKLQFPEIGTLHIFLAIDRFNEIDTWGLIYRIWAEQAHVQICAPRIDRERDVLLSVPLERNSQIEENTWGVPEPVGSTIVDPKEIDVVIVPLLCADQLGYRVGYGKGYYDRFLATCRPDCKKIGLSFFPPIERITDVNEFDVRIDELIYPSDGLQR